MPAVIVVIAAYAASTAVVTMVGVAALGIVGSIVVGALVGAVVGGLTAAVLGEDVMDGFKMGAMTGALAGGAAAWSADATVLGEAGAPSQTSTALATGDIAGSEAVGVTGEGVINSGGDLTAGSDLVGSSMPDPTGASTGVEVGTAGTDVATAGTDVAKAGTDVAKAGGDAGMISRVETLEAAAKVSEGITMSDKLALGGSLLQGYGEGEAAEASAQAAKELREADAAKLQEGVDPRRATFTMGDSGPTKVQLETTVAQGGNARRAAPVKKLGLINNQA